MNVYDVTRADLAAGVKLSSGSVNAYQQGPSFVWVRATAHEVRTAELRCGRLVQELLFSYLREGVFSRGLYPKSPLIHWIY